MSISTYTLSIIIVQYVMTFSSFQELPDHLIESAAVKEKRVPQKVPLVAPFWKTVSLLTKMTQFWYPWHHLTPLDVCSSMTILFYITNQEWCPKGTVLVPFIFLSACMTVKI